MKITGKMAGSVLTCIASGAVCAQSNPPAPEPGRLTTVIVIGQRAAATNSQLAGSLDSIGRSELEYEHVDDTMELLAKAPGVYFSRFNQGIINTDIAIRGFAADGGTPHAKLLIDGIPSHLHSGFSEMDQLFPLGIESIQVFKGTSDPRYGTYNIAGNYNIETRADTGTLEAEATLGSYRSREAQGYAGLQHGRLRHSYFLGYRESEGYRDHTELQKFAASGRWFYELAEATSLGLTARFSGYEGDAPGYLSRDVARRQPRSSADFANQDGGDKRIDHLALHFDTLVAERIDWSVKAYRQHFERERWVRFSAAGSLQNRFEDEWHSGASTTLGWQLNEQWQLSWGADFEHRRVVEQRFGTTGQSRQRDSANVLRNWHYSFDTLGSYLQIDHAPNRHVRWNAALRADRLDGEFAQFSSAGARTTRTIYDFGTIVQPTLNLFVTPVERFTLFANLGRSFQHPLGADAFTASSTRARDVSINDGWEAGLKYAFDAGLELRASHWQQRAKDEFVSVDGTPQNVGRTAREGYEFAANWRPHDRVYLWGNYSTVDSAIRKPSDDQAAFAGNELRSIPDYTASMGIAVDATSSFTARLHVDSQGDYYLNEANLGGQFGGYTLLNAGVDYRTRWGKLSVQINNLLDRFHEYAYDFSQDGTDTIHSPGDGVNGSVSMAVAF